MYNGITISYLSVSLGFSGFVPLGSFASAGVLFLNVFLSMFAL